MLENGYCVYAGARKDKDLAELEPQGKFEADLPRSAGPRYVRGQADESRGEEPLDIFLVQ